MSCQSYSPAFFLRAFVAYQTPEAVLGSPSAQPQSCSINGFWIQQSSVSRRPGVHLDVFANPVFRLSYAFPPHPMFIKLIAYTSGSYCSYDMASHIRNNHDPDPITDYNPT